MSITRDDLTGLVLAGGAGSRMGGADKGLQPFRGQPLALRALQRLAPQVGAVAISANRQLTDYAAFGAPVWTDTLADRPGPLAGMLAGLARCETRWLATVPCDSPFFPVDLVMRLAAAADAGGAPMAMAAAPDATNALRLQPVHCLLHIDLLASLTDFMAAGGRKAGVWAAQQQCVRVAFDRPGDDPRAFCNANTLAELKALHDG